ncbi:MAG: GMP synthase [Gammaproteobacteria bacterium]|nr:GMP synthase [Gammaproteobacteria bacterium]
MKVAILLCDQVKEEYQERFGLYQDMIASMLAPFFDELEISTFNCHLGEIPDDLHAFDFYISSGSRSSVYDDEPWIGELIEFVQLLNRHQKKFIGICFGHQLIGIALDGKVEQSDKGWGIGIATKQMLTHSDWMTEKPQQLKLLVSHQDQVIELPPEAEIVAGSDFCPHFMVQWNPHFFSVQGHPEWSPDYAHRLIHDRRDQYPEATFNQALESFIEETDNLVFSQWIRQFIDQD